MTLNDPQMSPFVGQLATKVAQIIRECGTADGFEAAYSVAQSLDARGPSLGARRPHGFIGMRDGHTVVATLIGSMQSGAYP